MSQVAHNAIARSTQHLLSYLAEDGAVREYSAQNQYQLEDDILICDATIQSAIKSYHHWRTRVANRQEAFSLETKREHHEQLVAQLEVIAVLENKIRRFQRMSCEQPDAIGPIAKTQDLKVAQQMIQSILNEDWFPVAPISAAFEDIELDDENCEFFNTLLK